MWGLQLSSRTQVAPLMRAPLPLFAAGNQIPIAPSLYPPHLCPSLSPPRSLCTPANTRLITAPSIGPRLAPKGTQVLSSLSLLCQSLPPRPLSFFAHARARTHAHKCTPLNLLSSIPPTLPLLPYHFQRSAFSFRPIMLLFLKEMIIYRKWGLAKERQEKNVISPF